MSAEEFPADRIATLVVRTHPDIDDAEITPHNWPNEPTLIIGFDRPGGTASVCSSATWTMEQASRALLLLSTELAIQAGAEDLIEVAESKEAPGGDA